MPSDTRSSICMVLVYKATVAIASSQCSGFGKIKPRTTSFTTCFTVQFTNMTGTII